MEKTKYNPAQHRLHYAFMLFRAHTIKESQQDSPRRRMARSQQFKELLRENNPFAAGSALNSSLPAEAINLTNHSIIEEKNH